jgi:hypothetical protein
VYTTPSWNNLHQAQTQKMEKLKKCGAKKTQKASKGLTRTKYK